MYDLSKVAHELAKLASLLAPGVEDEIGKKRNEGALVQDKIDSNKNLSWYSEQFMPVNHAPVEDTSAMVAPSLAQAQTEAQEAYGTMSHNNDFYPKNVDQRTQELLYGEGPEQEQVIARKATKALKAKRVEASKDEITLKVAKQLIQLASLMAPGIEDTIGKKRNDGPNVQDRIDSNKNFTWYTEEYKAGERN